MERSRDRQVEFMGLLARAVPVLLFPFRVDICMYSDFLWSSDSFACLKA